MICEESEAAPTFLHSTYRSILEGSYINKLTSIKIYNLLASLVIVSTRKCYYLYHHHVRALLQVRVAFTHFICYSILQVACDGGPAQCFNFIVNFVCQARHG